MQTNPEQWAQDLFWAALKAGDNNNYEAAYAVIQAAFAEREARNPHEKTVRWALPEMLRWIDHNRTAPRVPSGELVGQVLQIAADRIERLAKDSNEASEREARLVGALEQIATVDMGGGFLGAQACRKVALAAVKDRTHG